MARGLDNHKMRVDTLKSFGRELTRRSGAKCELCGAGGVSLDIFEVPPVHQEPDIERCIFICERCKNSLQVIKRKSSEHWRCLSDKIWSDIPAVKVLSIMVLREISGRESWAQQLLDDIYLSEEEELWADKGLF